MGSSQLCHSRGIRLSNPRGRRRIQLVCVLPKRLRRRRGQRAMGLRVAMMQTLVFGILLGLGRTTASDGVDNGITAVLGSELRLGWSQIPRHLLGDSPTASCRWLLPCFLKASSEALAIQDTVVPGKLPWSLMRTVAWRHRINSSQQPGTRHPLICFWRRPEGPAAESSAKDSGASEPK